MKYKEGQDVRFTRSKDNRYVYAISLKWPGDKFTSQLVRPRKKSKIIMLGDKGWFGNPKKLRWSLDEKEGLVIEIPERLQKEKNRPCKQAYVFRIEQSLD
ncbi:MAG: alpha-L-fucosidase C-terminal domain-containing protein [Planctomycetota bacterium]